jgi:hypothetical protein
MPSLSSARALKEILEVEGIRDEGPRGLLNVPLLPVLD